MKEWRQRILNESIFLAESLPSARWIVNFDLDFMDGLVLAAVLAAHCPFLVTELYLSPTYVFIRACYVCVCLNIPSYIKLSKISNLFSFTGDESSTKYVSSCINCRTVSA